MTWILSAYSIIPVMIMGCMSRKLNAVIVAVEMINLSSTDRSRLYAFITQLLF